MARFWKPRNRPAVVWNPKKHCPLFEFSPEGFFDTEDKNLIAYMKKAGYYLLSESEIASSDKFIAEQLKKRGQQQTGFVETVPMPDVDENDPTQFEPVSTSAVGPGDAADAPHPVPEVRPVQGGTAASKLPAFDFEELDDEGPGDDPDYESVAYEPPPEKKSTAKPTAKKTTTPRKTRTIKRRTKE